MNEVTRYSESEMAIMALIQKTDAALHRIVKIRRSMEPHIDFNQFSKGPKRETSYPMLEQSESHLLSASSCASTISCNDMASQESKIDIDRFSAFSSLSSSLITSIHMEQRMERLQSISITFIEGYAVEYYTTVARFLFSTLPRKTHHIRAHFYKQSFTGRNCIQRLVSSGFCDDTGKALRLCNVLIQLHFIQHVYRETRRMEDTREDLYRFMKKFTQEIQIERIEKPLKSDAATETYDFGQASDAVHVLMTEDAVHTIGRVCYRILSERNKIFEHGHWTQCFYGAELVYSLRDCRIAESRVDAVLIGQALIDEEFVEIVSAQIDSFQDSFEFFRFCAEKA